MFRGDHTYEPVPIAISLISNVYYEKQGELNPLSYIRNFRDEVSSFDELSCGSDKASLGRFCGSEILGVLKNFRKKV